MKHYITVKAEQKLDETNKQAFLEMSPEEREKTLTRMKNEIKKLFIDEGCTEDSFKEVSVWVEEGESNE